MRLSIEPSSLRATLLRATATVAIASCLGGCDSLAARRLVGRWRTDGPPERTLDLFADGTYALRFSGKTLGLVSRVLGAEKGTWRVDGKTLLLASRDEEGVERSTRMPIAEMAGSEVVLAGDRWHRLAEGAP